ncbi:unnamed protein product [Closterium sp. NIES-54]
MPPGILPRVPPLKAAADILRQHPHASIEVLPLDLSRPASVVRFCHLVRSRLGLDAVMIGAEEGIEKVGEKARSIYGLLKSNSSLEEAQQGSRQGGEEEENEGRAKEGSQGGGEERGLEEEAVEEEEEEEEEGEEKGFLWGQQQQQWQTRMAQVPSPMPPLCLLVNNAGILSPTASHRSAPASLPVDRMLATNYLGPVLLTLRLLPLMGRRAPSLLAQAHGGNNTGACGEAEERLKCRIVNISLTSGLQRLMRRVLKSLEVVSPDASQFAFVSSLLIAPPYSCLPACSVPAALLAAPPQSHEASLEESQPPSQLSRRLRTCIRFPPPLCSPFLRAFLQHGAHGCAEGAALLPRSHSQHHLLPPRPLLKPSCAVPCLACPFSPIDPGMVCTAVLRELPSLFAATVNTRFSLLSLFPVLCVPCVVSPLACPLPFSPIDPGMVRTAVLRELPSLLAATVNTIFSLLGLCLLPHALVPLFLCASTAPQVSSLTLVVPEISMF